jgi:putative transposase
LKRQRISEEKIIYALKQVESGVKVTEICRQMGVSTNTFYLWRRKYSGLGVTESKKLRQLQDENDRLKKLVADLTLDKHILQEGFEKKL